MNIADLFRYNIRNLAPYSTARDEYQGGEIGIFLDANESPYDNGYNRYPDPHQIKLKEKIGKIKGIAQERIFIGNGSDEPIDLVFRVFCEPGVDNAISIAPTYGMYKVAAAINNVELREVQLESDFSLNADKLLHVADNKTKLLFLCSPNNPTANSFPAATIERIIREFRGIVVLDEAYIDFAEQPSFLERLSEFENLVILQTLSKAWAMAGLRLGLAFGNQQVIATMSRVKYPYNINRVTQDIVLGELDKSISAHVKELKSERARVENSFRENSTIKKIYHSDANFILVKVDEPETTYNALIEKGIIVRDRSRIKGCEGCLRITIGTPRENDTLIETMKNLGR